MTDPCQIDGDQGESDMIADRYAQRMSALGDNLLHGTLTLDQFHESLQDAIRLSFLHQSVAGAPDSDERLITSADKARIEAGIARQYEFLDGFMSDIEAAVEKPGQSLDFIPNRASMYAGSSQAAYWQQATNNLDLPAQPKDGSSECLSNDDCYWSFDCEYDDQGNPTAVLATWNLGETEKHCDTCLERAATWNPLRIPIGVNA